MKLFAGGDLNEHISIFIFINAHLDFCRKKATWSCLKGI